MVQGQKKCKSGFIVNPASGRCVDADGPTGRSLRGLKPLPKFGPQPQPRRGRGRRQSASKSSLPPGMVNRAASDVATRAFAAKAMLAGRGPRRGGPAPKGMGGSGLFLRNRGGQKTAPLTRQPLPQKYGGFLSAANIQKYGGPKKVLWGSLVPGAQETTHLVNAVNAVRRILATPNPSATALQLGFAKPTETKGLWTRSSNRNNWPMKTFGPFNIFIRQEGGKKKRYWVAEMMPVGRFSVEGRFRLSPGVRSKLVFITEIYFQYNEWLINTLKSLQVETVIVKDPVISSKYLNSTL